MESTGSIAAPASAQAASTSVGSGLLVDRRSSPADKVKLFRSLFRGREDVYPVRFESRKTGRAGYSPACANEWVRGVCEKPRIKCSECVNRRLLPVTDEVVAWHLSGKDSEGKPFVMGVYPMLRDERCFFLAVDFDEGSWEEDALAYLETCRALGLPAALERSRSGAGGHVWMFFNGAVPAGTARRLGSHLLTETMERRPSIGLKSYDRLFPNQDTLPRGGFGNLIALPLQQLPRTQGNSLFVDDRLQPFDDQWAFLSQLGCISSSQLERIVADAERRGRVLGVRFVADEENQVHESPWELAPSRRRKDPPIAGTLPPSLEVVFADQIYLPKESLPPALQNRLIRLAAFQNPEFYRAQAMRLPTYDKPRVISCAEETPEHIGLPRGCEEDLRALLKELGVKLNAKEKRSLRKPLMAKFLGELRPDQLKAAEAMLAHDIGVLSATTAFGKTVLAAWLIAQRGVNTLILVHRQQLLEQWVERLNSFLDVSAKSIGRLGGGRRKLTGVIDVALMQSLVRKDVVDDRVSDYGHLVVDECHHLSARSFELVARRAKARYVTGLSATVVRKDGHHPIIFMQCGPVRHRVDAKEQAANRPFSHHVIVRATSFHSVRPPGPDQRMEFHELYEELVANDARNRMIGEDVLNAVQEGRSPLVLTERTDHLETIAAWLRTRGGNVVTLQGGMKKKELCEVMEAVSKSHGGDGQIIVATGKYIGEGFDHPSLDTLFLALPVSWRGIIAQYVGRLHRLSDGKREVRVYDYADLNVPMLSRMFDRRCEGYEAVGYSILLPASALPGWPADVPLPIDLEWKRDYAASVRRLIRDGVDTTLGGLFLNAARKAESPVNSIDQARSASEQFIYHRLETLSDTKGAFRMNSQLPIAFDGFGRMEVDFLCSEAGLVIEVDGSQHFTDAEAYRRDRRKDFLLQENGYFVLRFLAADLALHLDSILDTVLRTLAHRRRRKIESQ